MAQRDWFPEAALLQEVYSAGVLAALLVDGELDKAGVSTHHFCFLGWVGVFEPVTRRALSAETGMPTTIRDYAPRSERRSAMESYAERVGHEAAGPRG